MRPILSLALVPLLLGACADVAPELESTPILLSAAPRDAAAQASRSPACRRHGYRDFDFWVGRWVITQANGQPGGVSAITKELGGCAVMETYQGGGGRSLNLFDRARDRWTQTYMDGGGLLLRLA